MSSPLHPAARETLLAALDVGWGDPRRLHREGRQARQLLDQAREILAGALGMRPDETSFHASPAHALLRGLDGLCAGRRRVGPSVTTSAIDQAVIRRRLCAQDHDVPVDQRGHIDADAWARQVSQPGVAVAVTALGNAEIGTRQHLDPLATAARSAGVPLLLDVAASWGRVTLPPDAEAYAGDAASFAGPPLGVLSVRTGVRFGLDGPPSGPELGRDLAPMWVPLALAAAEAWRQSETTQERDAEEARGLIDAIRAAAASAPEVQVVGDPVERLPHVLTFSALYVDGESLVREFDRRGYAVASGSACTADTLEPSHVLAAIGAITHGNVRITLPRASVAPHRAEWVRRFCADLPDVISTVRSQSGLDLS